MKISRLLALSCLHLSVTPFSYSQLSLTSTGTNFNINFDASVTNVSNGTFSGSGFISTPTVGQLDAEAWEVIGFSDGSSTFGVGSVTGDFARGVKTGVTTSGGVYAFDVSGSSDFALGVQPIGSDFTPGTMALRIDNNSGSVINTLAIEYEVWIFNDQDRASSFNFSYSTNNSSYTDVSSLDITSVETADLSPTWTQTNRSTVISGLNLADGASFFIRWSGNDVSGSGSRDQFAVDDITVRVPVTYTWNGAWDNDPSGVSTSFDTINVSATGASISAATSCNTLTVAAGASINLNSNTLTVADTAFIKAGASGYAQIIGAISGTTTVESYRTGSSAKWLNMAFPVNATLANVSGVSLNTTGVPASCNIYRFDASIDGDANDEGDWTAISNSTDETENIAYTLFLDNGTNFGTFPATIKATGTLLDGDQNVAVSNATTNAWNFIPNPYASTLEWNAFAADADNTELANTTYYMQDGNTNLGSVVYRTYNGTTGTNGGSNDIPPGQSFFVQADASGNLTFKNTHRNITGNTSLYKTATGLSYLKVKATNTSTLKSDETVLGFSYSFNDQIDAQFDAEKRRNSVFPNLFTKSNSNEMIFNGISNQFSTHSEVLYFECSESGDYRIDISEAHINPNWVIELEDVTMHTYTNLISKPYVFTHNTSAPEDRFILHIRNKGIGTNEFNAQTIYAYLNDDLIHINLNHLETPSTIVLLDITGKTVLQTIGEPLTLNTLTISHLNNGVYILSVRQGETELYHQKVMK